MRWIKIVLVILWMMLIFMFSNNSGVNSTNQSNSFIRTPIVIISRMLNKQIDEDKINQIIEIIEVPIRKCAHIFLYFILGILVSSLLKTYNLSFKQRFVYAFVICVLYSISDEIHQLFIPGRSGNIKDIFIDSLGIYLGIFLKTK